MLSRFAVLAALAIGMSAGQDTGLLRIRVTLADAGVPRVVLLVSDNPATASPRRVRTGADGTIELTLKPGSYTVESDLPVTLAGNAYTWTEMINVVAGQTTALELTATNAAIEKATTSSTASGATTATSVDAESATLFSKWRDAVVEIWTPTRHASGFLIDARGVIATSHHAIGEASVVEVEIATASARLKVPGSVLASDRLTGAAFVRIDPRQLAATPVSPGCGSAAPSVAYDQEIFTVAAPMLADKDMIEGAALRITSQAIFADMRLSPDSTGGPVFAATGELLGISALNEDEERRIREYWVVPIARLCEAFAAAEKKLAASVVPPGTSLPLEPRPAASRSAAADASPRQQPRTQPPKLQASDFDVTLTTPALVAQEPDRNSPLADFGDWSEYVRRAPHVLLVRVSPQFEESFWKTLARGAAATQGMALPPLKSFTSNFHRLRAYCGDTEVMPIHPFIIERQVSEKASIREGLYVFPIDAFGTQCSSVRLAMYSEKDLQKADTKTIDPKLFEQVAKSGVQ